MTKDLLNGIAVTGLLALSIFLPVIGPFFALFIPLPVLYYRLKLGRRIGALIPLVVICTIAIPDAGKLANILFTAELLVIGFLLGECAEKSCAVEKTVLLPSVIVLVIFLISMFFYSSFTGIDLISVAAQAVEAHLETVLSANKELLMPQENLSLVKEKLPEISAILVGIIPGMIMAHALLASWLYLLLATAVFKAHGMGHFEFGRLNQWHAPESFVWGVIGAGLVLFIPVPAIMLVGFNVLAVLLVVYFFQGMAIVSFYFEKKKLPRGLRIVLYMFIAIQQLLIFFVIGLGFFDVWLDIRKLHPQEPEES